MESGEWRVREDVKPLAVSQGSSSINESAITFDHQSNDPIRLLPTRFLFRFSAACRYRDPLWTAEGAGLDESYRLPRLAELEERPAWAEVRAAWSEAGLAFAVHVRGKKQPPWCRESRLDDSDCLQIWIDTRDVHNVHRAGRFCHRFIFLPCGGGPAARSSRWPARCRSTVRGSSPTRFRRSCCRPLANGRATTIYWRR